MAASYVFKMLLPGTLTRYKNFESYLTHFKLLAANTEDIQNSRGATRKLGERPHYFVLGIEKSAIELYRT